MNPNQLEAIISQLDSFLKQGHEDYNHILRTTRDAQAQPGYDEEKSYQEANKMMNDWYVDAQLFMQGNLSRQYHLVHFTMPKVSGLRLTGIPTKIANLLANWEARIHALEDVVLRFEDQRNLLIRQEIAEKEYQSGVLYQITYTQAREIKVNGIIVAKPDFASENDQFFLHVFHNPNRPLQRTAIEQETGLKLKKTNNDIVAGLGFTGSLRQIFWSVSKTTVQLNNPITKQYALDNDLPVINLTELTKRNREVGRGSTRSRKK